MTLPQYAIGTTAGGIQSLTELGIPLPKADVVDYAEYVENGAGELVGQGWLATRWRWAVLHVDDQAVLTAYAGTCYIRTLTENADYATYSALMVLPPRKPPKAGQQMDYVIEFRKLVAA